MSISTFINFFSTFFNTYLYSFILVPDLFFIIIIFYYLISGLFVITTVKQTRNNTYYPIKASYYCFKIATCLILTGFLQGYFALYWEYLACPDKQRFLFYWESPKDLISLKYFFENNLIISPFILKLKIVLSFFVANILYLSQYFLKNNKLNNYEFAFIISIILISLWISISSISWLILYLSLELQGIGLLILIAWSRNLISSINIALKYGVINFIASLLILYGIVRLILLTGTTEILYFNIDNYVKFNHHLDLKSYISYIYFISWPLSLILFGLFIKLGVVPFAAWIPELYASLLLPILIFFSTVPKFVYILLISNIITIHFSYFIFDQIKWFFLSLAIITTTIGTLGLIIERKNILRFLGWSSISNIGFLFLLWGLIDQNLLGLNLSLTYIFYYSINLLLFLGIFNFVKLNFNNRSIFYFSDLQIFARHYSLIPFYFIIILSFLSFLGLPPLLGFWGKFIIIKSLLLFITTPFEWFIVIIILFIILISGFNYIRLFNINCNELIIDNPKLSIRPIIKINLYKYIYLFLYCQICCCLLIPCICVFFNLC